MKLSGSSKYALSLSKILMLVSSEHVSQVDAPSKSTACCITLKFLPGGTTKVIFYVFDQFSSFVSEKEVSSSVENSIVEVAPTSNILITSLMDASMDWV